MKTKLFFLAFLTSLLSWGQGVEDFSNIPTAFTGTYLARTGQELMVFLGMQPKQELTKL